jgi:hypothetical protein
MKYPKSIGNHLIHKNRKTYKNQKTHNDKIGRPIIR